MGTARTIRTCELPRRGSARACTGEPRSGRLQRRPGLTENRSRERKRYHAGRNRNTRGGSHRDWHLRRQPRRDPADRARSHRGAGGAGALRRRGRADRPSGLRTRHQHRAAGHVPLPCRGARCWRAGRRAGDERQQAVRIGRTGHRFLHAGAEDGRRRLRPRRRGREHVTLALRAHRGALGAEDGRHRGHGHDARCPHLPDGYRPHGRHRRKRRGRCRDHPRGTGRVRARKPDPRRRRDP